MAVKIQMNDLFKEPKKFFKDLWQWRKERKEAKRKKKMQPQTMGERMLSWTKTIVGAVIVVMIINGLALASFVVPTGSMENTVMTGDFLFVNKFIYGPSTPQVIPFLNIPLPYYKFPAVRDPRRGDVIVFIYPGDRDEVNSKEFQYYLKRCVAIAGDTLELKNNQLYVNHVFQNLPPNGKYDPSVSIGNQEKWYTFPLGKGYTRADYGPIRVPKKGDTVYLNEKTWYEWEYFIKKEGHEIYSQGTSIMIDNKPCPFYIVNRNYCFGMGDNRDHSQDSRFWGFVPYENVVGTPIMVYWSWETRNENDEPYSFFEKIARIRWSRFFRFIN